MAMMVDWESPLDEDGAGTAVWVLGATFLVALGVAEEGLAPVDAAGAGECQYFIAGWWTAIHILLVAITGLISASGVADMAQYSEKTAEA
jgi:hypothetical protein